MITKEEFEKRYCEDSEITLEEYHESQVTLHCDCGYRECKGWAAVSNNPLSIKAHNDLYTVEGRQKLRERYSNKY